MGMAAIHRLALCLLVMTGPLLGCSGPGSTRDVVEIREVSLIRAGEGPLPISAREPASWRSILICWHPRITPNSNANSNVTTPDCARASRTDAAPRERAHDHRGRYPTRSPGASNAFVTCTSIIQRPRIRAASPRRKGTGSRPTEGNRAAAGRALLGCS